MYGVNDKLIQTKTEERNNLEETLKQKESNLDQKYIELTSIQEELGLDQLTEYKNLKTYIELKNSEKTDLESVISDLQNENAPKEEIEFYTNLLNGIHAELTDLNNRFSQYDGSMFLEVTKLEEEIKTISEEITTDNEKISELDLSILDLQETNYTEENEEQIKYKIIRNNLTRPYSNCYVDTIKLLKTVDKPSLLEDRYRTVYLVQKCY